MPIKPEYRHFYTGQHWKETRERILARAKNKCEQCGKPNHKPVVYRTLEGRMWWRPIGRQIWRDDRGTPANPPVTEDRTVVVILTVAHRNHIPGDDRDENLAAWCQWCHLTFDIDHRRESRILRKEAERPLLAPAVEVEKLREFQRTARDEYLRTGNEQAFRGMADYLMEECILLSEGG